MLSSQIRFPKSVLRIRLAATLSVLLFSVCTPSRAALINFEATNLTDTTMGQDLWEYSYRLSEFAFAASQGFTVFFDRTLFTLIQSPPPPVNAGWDLLTVQPDLGLNSDGFYDGLGLINSPSLADAFKVKVVWLGTGSPGAQPFTIYDTNFSPITQGQTTPLPEPAATLFVLGLAGFAFTGLRRRRRAVR